MCTRRLAGTVPWDGSVRVGVVGSPRFTDSTCRFLDGAQPAASAIRLPIVVSEMARAGAVRGDW